MKACSFRSSHWGPPFTRSLRTRGRCRRLRTRISGGAKGRCDVSRSHRCSVINLATFGSTFVASAMLRCARLVSIISKTAGVKLTPIAIIASRTRWAGEVIRATSGASAHAMAPAAWSYPIEARREPSSAMPRAGRSTSPMAATMAPLRRRPHSGRCRSRPRS